MTDRERLENALTLARTMQAKLAGPCYPGRTQEIRDVLLSELVETLKGEDDDEAT